MYCPKCGKENDEDALFCKKCGFPLDENPENYNEPVNTKYKKGKNKTKIKNKTKTKTKYKNNNEKVKGKMSFFQSFIMFFFIVLSICALAAAAFLGYYIYQNQNIVVPDVTGYSYESAVRTLQDNKLQAEKIEVTVEDEEQVGQVLKQNKKAGSKVMENTVIKLTVGILDTKITVPSLTGLTLDEALNILNENNIKYEIKYETSDKKPNTILNQNIKSGKKIENTQTLTITVSKPEEKPQTPEDNQTDTEPDDEQPTQNEDQTENPQNTNN